jgi:predicted glycosyltransferase involved in capsule biosynthesis
MVLLSYCISIMNRLYQIEKTLRVNIDNSTDNSEFIIVDYNSNDGLKEYIYNNFQTDISNGKLKYNFTDKIKYWHASICKNTTHMKASGKYLVNLDCDNFIGKNGDELILNTFLENGDNIIISQTNNIVSSGNGGRISITQDNFIQLGGYDESFYPMGYQDYDLIERANIFGLKYININKNNKAIINSKKESIKNIGIKMEYNKMNNMNKLLSKLNIDNNNLKVNLIRGIGIYI